MGREHEHGLSAVKKIYAGVTTFVHINDHTTLKSGLPLQAGQALLIQSDPPLCRKKSVCAQHARSTFENTVGDDNAANSSQRSPALYAKRKIGQGTGRTLRYYVVTMKPPTNDQVEAMLHAGESATLDYKSQQYKFIGATDKEKSQLLKDVLAMANAGKDVDAHLLIGVKENPGSRAIIVGISVSDHIDDSRLQQFVNGKTNVPVDFAYHALEIDGQSIAVITIARAQRRPIYIDKAFGDVDEMKVYVRRGSSTAVATPDEIAAIGEARVRSSEHHEASLHVAYKRSGGGPERHEYHLLVTLRNDGATTIANRVALIEMPRAILPRSDGHAAEARGEGSVTHALFRFTPKVTGRAALYPKSSEVFTLDYFMDGKLLSNSELHEQQIVVTAYAENRLVREVRLAFDDWQNF